ATRPLRTLRNPHLDMPATPDRVTIDEIRPALDRAQREVDRGSVALVNVKTDDRARAGTVAFAQYAT
ncbi:MAG: hypothetical protein WBE42_28930, partial [Pseudolabrys sp.]